MTPRWLPALALLAAGGAGCREPCIAPGVGCAVVDADLRGTAASGSIGGVAVDLDASRWSGDDACGPRGRVIEVLAGADCAAGDAGSGASLSIYLSDLRPGVYVFTGPVSCRAAPGGRGFFATFRDATGDRSAGGGAVTFDGGDPTAAGSFDLHFAGDDRLQGHFTAVACGS